MSSQQDTFNTANVPQPENTSERRQYIDQYIQRFHSDLVPQIDMARKEARSYMCRYYHNTRGMIDVPAVYFEYTIDKTLWQNIFLHLGEQAPAWPWKKGPDRDDISAGMSMAYREWRIEMGLPVSTPHQTDQQRAHHLELELSNAQQEIERLNLHLQDAKTLHQELKEAMQGWLNDKDALLKSKDQEILRLRMDGSNSGESQERLSLARRQSNNLATKLAMAKTEVADQKQMLATANSRITHLENRLTESPSKAQALETELAKANTRASNAEDNSRYLEGQLRDANTQLTSIQSQLPGQESQSSIRVPQGPLGELAAMYAVLAREVTDLPILPQALAFFDIDTLAVKVAPLLFRDSAKGKLRSFLAAGPSGWHCLETIVDGMLNPKGIRMNKCLDHKGDCVDVRVVNGEGGPLLEFSGGEE